MLKNLKRKTIVMTGGFIAIILEFAIVVVKDGANNTVLVNTIEPNSKIQDTFNEVEEKN